MAGQWSCSECGTKIVQIATLCIYEEETGNYRDFCFDCGVEALRKRMLELGKKEIVNGWHFTMPNLTGKQHVAINYMPDMVEY
jgi:hypothetical protein